MAKNANHKSDPEFKPEPKEQSEANNTHKTKNLLGPKLHVVRVLKSMTQQDVVKLMREKGHFFSTSTVSKIETQDRSLYDIELVSLLEIYHISLNELIKIDETNFRRNI